MSKFINKKEKKQEIRLSNKKSKFSRLRGMRDIVCDEYSYWNLVTQKAKSLASAYDFAPVEIPVLEKKELYDKNIGKNTDLITKELYSFIDKGGEKVAMRPEATLGIARTYVESNLFNKIQPVKMSWIGPVFRYNKSKTNALRQFHQFDLEILGEESPIADVQLILIAYNFFRELQVDVEVKLNSCGCADCRKLYIEELKDFYKPKIKRIGLCASCKKKVLKDPMHVLKCEEKKCIESLEEAPQIIDSICEECRDHFVNVLENLDALDIPYNLTPFLTKESNYYTRTIFEFFTVDENQNKQFSLGGGGRYNSLLEYMCSIPAPGCGFAINIEKTISKIKENNIFLKPRNEKTVFLAQISEKAKRKAFLLFEDLRRAGFDVAQSFTNDDLRSQLEVANSMKVKLILILGQKETTDNSILFRDIESGIQEVVEFDNIIKELKIRLK